MVGQRITERKVAAAEEQLLEDAEAVAEGIAIVGVEAEIVDAAEQELTAEIIEDALEEKE